MDSLITAAARALSAGDALGALKRVALRSDAPALALRGIAMAQMGDLDRAKELLRAAATAYGPKEPIARARCTLAQAEIALVSRDLGKPMRGLETARRVLAEMGDTANSAHAGYLEARRLLLLGALDDADAVLNTVDRDDLPPASRSGYWLVSAGIALRRIRTKPAENALSKAKAQADAFGAPALKAEVERAVRSLREPAARVITRDGEQRLILKEVEDLLAKDHLIVDACRNNPFKSSSRGASRGLAQMTAAYGSIVGYATAPGQIADDGDGVNSPFSKALSRAIRAPGLTIEEVLKQTRRDVFDATAGRQVPWVSSSLIGEFSFSRPSSEPARAKPVVTAALATSANRGAEVAAVPAAKGPSFDCRKASTRVEKTICGIKQSDTIMSPKSSLALVPSGAAARASS